MTIDKQTLCIENAFDIENQLYELTNNETVWDGGVKFFISESEKVLAFAAQIRQEAAK
ncbi:hypothetical protein G6E34_003789 [Salmonella enterica subsp. diarizonae]|nr:hypothetical protein [Salmonella enterica subsp. arizonae serovar 56:z4,z23:-]EEO7476545.1 hypothetical protein [Salmonella enterica subsp. diarizonae]EGV3636337.1 hypothetical protein [Salmonella enterica]